MTDDTYGTWKSEPANEDHYDEEQVDYYEEDEVISLKKVEFPPQYTL